MTKTVAGAWSWGIALVLLGAACSAAPAVTPTSGVAPTSAPGPSAPPATVPAAPSGVPPAPSASPSAPAASSPGPVASAPPVTLVPTPQASGSLKTIQVPVASRAAIYGPLFVAMDKGYFAEQGLDVQMMTAAGSTATPALLSGEAPFSTSAAAALNAGLQGAGVKVLFANGDHEGYQLWSTTPDVNTLQDLVGKTVGVTSRGDASELGVRILLQKNGIDPDSVNFSAIGENTGELAILESGALPAVTVGGATQAALGGNPPPNGILLANLQTQVEILFSGLATSDGELQNNRDEVHRFLTALMEGRAYFLTYREETIQILNKYNGLTSDKTAVDYDDTIPLMTPSGIMSDSALAADLQARAAVIGLAPDKVPPVSQLYDFGPLRQVNDDLATQGWKPTP